MRNDIRKYYAKSIGYPLQDYIKKTNISDTLNLLRESQYWDEEKICDYQLSKLQSLITHAYRNVPYYSDLFDSIKLKPSDIQSLDDIQKIPLLTKDIIIKENSKLLATDFNMRHVKKGKTGGTTGAPIVVYKDVANRSFTWASYFRWYEWMGVNYYDKVATLWGAATVTSKSLKRQIRDKTLQLLQNELRIDSFTMSDQNMMRVYEILTDNKPVLIKGYLSALLNYATFLKTNNLHAISPKALSSTTETLMPHHRKYIESIFKAPIYDQYGCGELSAISYECSAHSGLHINMEHIICEILDENERSVIDKKGRVVGTDLDNYVMPFIRYENGDISSIASTKCSCGINQPLMNSIDGRTVDTVELKSGENVHGVFFTDIFFELGILTNKIQKFQIYQNQPGKIELRVQCAEPMEKKKKQILLQSIQKYFYEVNYSEHKMLSNEENGKFKYIINKINS
jgi:phenylacetate-CoA ligase